MNEYNWNNWSWNYLADEIPNIIMAIIVFLLGWLVAKVIANAVEKALKKTNIDNKLFPNYQNRKVSSERVISKIIFYLLMIFVIVWVLNILSLSLIASPLVNMLSSITAVVPSVLKAALILVFAWALASILRYAVRKLGQKLNVQKLVTKWKDTDPTNSAKPENIIEQAANLVFYFVLLLFLPAVLAALDLEGISGPFTNMMNSVLAFLPNLFAAVLILLIGWFVAKLCRTIVTNFLLSIGTERFVNRLGMKRFFESTPLSLIAGHIVFVVIMIPIVISALEALNIEGISTPAINMLNVILSMIPNIIAAAIFIAAGIWVSSFVKKFVSQFLKRIGFDSLLQGMGAKTTASLSDIIGIVAQIFVAVLFIVQALNILHLDFLVLLGTGIIGYLPHVLAAVLILAAGIYVGHFVQKILKAMFVGEHFRILGAVAKYAIITFSVFMALDQLGVADSIVNSAFILILGGVSLAFGLAFGLGGKDTAAKYLGKLDKKIENTSVHVPSKEDRPDFWGKNMRNTDHHGDSMQPERSSSTPKRSHTGDSMENERKIRRQEEELIGDQDFTDSNPEGIPPHQPNELEKDIYPESHDKPDSEGPSKPE